MVTPLFDDEYLKNGMGQTRKLSYNGILIRSKNLHMPYSTVSFRMILSDLGSSEIFNDTKQRVASLRQLSFFRTITKSSAVAEKPRNAPCYLKTACIKSHQK